MISSANSMTVHRTVVALSAVFVSLTLAVPAFAAPGGGGVAPGGTAKSASVQPNRVCCEGVPDKRFAKLLAKEPPVALAEVSRHTGEILTGSGFVRLASAHELPGPLEFLSAKAAEELLAYLAERLRTDNKTDEASQLSAALLDLYRSAYLLRRGDDKAAAKVHDDIGLVTDWLVAGPFENSNMAGFDVGYGPEGTFDRKATWDGKVGTVGWRPLGLGHSGYVWLSGAVNPDRGAAVYAAAVVRSNKRQRAVLRFGADGAAKVWVGGRLAARLDTDLAGQLDSHAYGVTLEKGDNPILVKVAGENRGKLGFYLRFTDTNGRDLGLTSSTDIDNGARLASPEKHKGFAHGAPAERAQKDAERARGPEAPRQLVAAAAIWHKLAPRHPEAPWVAMARSAAKAGPDDPGVLRRASRHLPEHWERLELLQRARTKTPNDVWLQVDVIDEMGKALGMSRVPKMLALTDKAIKLGDALSTDQQALVPRLTRAALTGRHISKRSALAELETLVADYPNAKPLLTDLHSLARGLGMYSRIERFGKKLLAAWGLAPGFATNRAEFLLSSRRPEAALDLLDAVLAVRPDSLRTQLVRARVLEQVRGTDQAVAAIDELLLLSPGHVGALVVKGEILERGDRIDDARVAYQLALATAPENRGIVERIEALTPAAMSYEAAWKLGPEALEPPQGAAEDHAGLDYWYLATQQVVMVADSGRASRFTQEVVHVLNEDGARTWSSERVYYSPGVERVDVVSVRVRKADGTISETYRRRDGDAMTGPGNLYYSRRYALLEVSGLEPGDVVEYAYRVSEVGSENFREGYFGDIWFMNSHVDVGLARYVLITPEAMTIHTRPPQAKGVAAEEDTVDIRGGRFTVRSYEARDLGRVKTDRDQPGASEIYDYLLVSTYKTWSEVGKWWWNLIKDQLVVDDEIRSIVRKVTKGARSDREKVTAIHNWVVKNTRYVGIEFGVHGWKPYRTTLCVRRKFGDCKDKASLIKVMLNEAGIDANLVLIRTRRLGNVSDSPANLAIFNHAIAYVPKFDLFLDGTAEFSGTTELPHGDQGRLVVIVADGGKVTVRKTPVDPPDANRHLRVLEVDLSGEEFIVKGRLEATGADAVYYRRKFQSTDKRNEALEGLLTGSFPGITLVSAEFKEVTSLEKPVLIDFTMKGGGFIKQVGDEHVLFPAGREIRMLDQYAPAASRDQDLMLGVPYTSVHRVRYKLPDKLALSSKPKNRTTSGPFGSYSLEFKKNGDTLEVEVSYAIRPDRVSKKEYAAFREWLAELDRAVNQPITLNWGE